MYIYIQERSEYITLFNHVCYFDKTFMLTSMYYAEKSINCHTLLFDEQSLTIT